MILCKFCDFFNVLNNVQECVIQCYLHLFHIRSVSFNQFLPRMETGNSQVINTLISYLFANLIGCVSEVFKNITVSKLFLAANFFLLQTLSIEDLSLYPPAASFCKHCVRSAKLLRHVLPQNSQKSSVFEV